MNRLSLTCHLIIWILNGLILFITNCDCQHSWWQFAIINGEYHYSFERRCIIVQNLWVKLILGAQDLEKWIKWIFLCHRSCSGSQVVLHSSGILHGIILIAHLDNFFLHFSKKFTVILLTKWVTYFIFSSIKFLYISSKSPLWWFH